MEPSWRPGAEIYLRSRYDEMVGGALTSPPPRRLDRALRTARPLFAHGETFGRLRYGGEAGRRGSGRTVRTGDPEGVTAEMGVLESHMIAENRDAPGVRLKDRGGS